MQLSALGRYVLAVGPTPPPRPAFEQFLFVQPNFEVIAYRQGLTPQLVGRLSRFAWWTQIGSALELKLSRESIVFGLDRGSKPEWMLETLTRHSQRPLSRGVIEAINHWAERRERVVFYAATTLIEFGNQSRAGPGARALAGRRRRGSAGAVAERFLLVEDDRTVPYARLRLTSSRDYRRPPDVCVTVEPDGVTLVLDPARADLWSMPSWPSSPTAYLPRTKLRASRSGAAAPVRDHGRVVAKRDQPRAWPRAATERMVRAPRGKADPGLRSSSCCWRKSSRVPTLKAARIVVLTLPRAEVLEGLRQHPATRRFLGEGLGPTSVAVPENQVAALQSALKELGITLDVE